MTPNATSNVSNLLFRIIDDPKGRWLPPITVTDENSSNVMIGKNKRSKRCTCTCDTPSVNFTNILQATLSILPVHVI